MNWNNIQLVFLREVRDQLRDRRTLMMVAVLPLLLYPALGFLMMQIMLSVTRQEQTVVIVNAEELPAPSLMTFLSPNDAQEALVVLTDDQAIWPAELELTKRERLEKLLTHIKDDETKIHHLAELKLADRTQSTTGDALAEAEIEQLRIELEQWFEEAKVEVIVIFPEGFREAYEAYTAQVTSGKSGVEIAAPKPLILQNSANDNSVLAAQKVKHAFQDWEQALLDQRLEEVNLPIDFVNPVPIDTLDLAEADKIAANVWSKVLPALLVLFSVTGALYPAIDLGAGEKERGTMETLLISPATRTEIVLGKFLTVMLFSYSTAVLNLVSMGFTFQNTLSAIGAVKDSPMGSLTFPPLTSVAWVILFALPIAALFSALSLSLAMFAKSSKEGQYYLTPLLMVALGLTMFCMFPGVELRPYQSVMPVVGPSLLLKSLLLDGILSKAVLTYGIPVLVSSIGYSLLALWWAIDLFQREDILFRESERFDIGLWLKHLLREKESTPSFVEAGVCFVLIGLLQYAFLISMQSSNAMSDAVSMMKVQTIYLIATVGVPPILMALLLTTNMFKTLKLQLPEWKFIAVGTILGFTMQPLMLELIHRIDWFFPPPPPGAVDMMKAMTAEQVPFWLALGAFALAPAVCEELAFRGFILSGLERSRRQWLPILISAMLFGVIHMIPKQMFNAALLGVVIGLLAVRSRSLIPGVIFHFIFNGTQVAASRMTSDQVNPKYTEWMFLIDPKTGEPGSFSIPLLLICAIISASLITWLIRTWTPEKPLDQFFLRRESHEQPATNQP